MLNELKRKIASRSDRTLWAIGLVRVSTKAQGDVMHGSLEQQQNMLNRYVENLGKEYNCKVKFHSLITEEVSGKHDSIRKRTELLKAQMLIENGSIDIFIIEKVDRLSRDSIFNATFLRTANRAGCIIFKVDHGPIDLRNRRDRLSFTLENSTAEDYTLELGEKIERKQREAMVNNGKDVSTLPLLGLDAHPTKAGFYEVNADEKAIVIDIFQHFERTGSLTELAEFCEKKGYREKARWTKERVDRQGNRIPPQLKGGGPFRIRNLHTPANERKTKGQESFSRYLEPIL